MKKKLRLVAATLGVTVSIALGVGPAATAATARPADTIYLCSYSPTVTSAGSQGIYELWVSGDCQIAYKS